MTTNLKAFLSTVLLFVLLIFISTLAVFVSSLIEVSVAYFIMAASYVFLFFVVSLFIFQAFRIIFDALAEANE